MNESLPSAVVILQELARRRPPSDNDATNAVPYDLTATTNQITQSPLFWQRRFVDGAMVRCCVSNFGFSLLQGTIYSQ